MVTTSKSGSTVKVKSPVKPIVKKKKAIKKNYYFHQGTENAIIRYNKSDNPVLRNTIYNEHIRAAFDKLAENIIHTFKFYYFDVSSEEVKHEVVSFLVLNIKNNKCFILPIKHPTSTSLYDGKIIKNNVYFRELLVLFFILLK